MFHHNTMSSTFGPSSSTTMNVHQNSFIHNDENAIQHQHKKQLSTRKGSSKSSSSSALKPKKGLALQQINVNSNNVSFPKTPLSSSKTKKSSNTSRRRALGDISNNRKSAGGGAGFTSAKNKSSKSNVSFRILDTSTTSVDNNVGVNTTVHKKLSTKKNRTTKKKKKPLGTSSISTNSNTDIFSQVKKKSVVFHDEIYGENDTQKITQQLPKKNKGVLKSKSLIGTKEPSSGRINYLSNEVDNVDDIELSFGRTLNKEEEMLQDDLIGDIDDRDKFNFDTHLKMIDKNNWLQQEQEFQETIREGNAILAKEMEMLQNSECEENDLYSKTFEDEFSHKLNDYNFDEEEDNFYASPYYNDLDDLSI